VGPARPRGCQDECPGQKGCPRCGPPAAHRRNRHRTAPACQGLCSFYSPFKRASPPGRISGRQRNGRFALRVPGTWVKSVSWRLDLPDAGVSHYSICCPRISVTLFDMLSPDFCPNPLNPGVSHYSVCCPRTCCPRTWYAVPGSPVDPAATASHLDSTRIQNYHERHRFSVCFVRNLVVTLNPNISSPNSRRKHVDLLRFQLEEDVLLMRNHDQIWASICPQHSQVFDRGIRGE